MKLLEQLKETAKREPQRLFWENGTDTLTYGALWEASGSMASHLAERFPGIKGAPLALFAEKAAWVPAAMIAAIRLGVPYLPLDPRSPASRAEAILREARPFLLLGNSTGSFPAEDPLPLLTGGSTFTERDIPDSAPLYILYTSGSTGRPKGVILSRGNLSAFLRWLLPQLPGEAPVLLGTSPYSFDLSVLPLYGAMASGGRVFELSPTLFTDFPLLFDRLRSSGAECFVATPSTAGLLLVDPDFNAALLPALRQFFFCGEALPPRLVKKLRSRFPGAAVINSYGPTEATVAITSLEITDGMADRETVLPIGRADAGGNILVVDETLRPLPDGTVGELLLTGEQIGLGYQDGLPGGYCRYEGRPAYRTGDYGVVRDGLLYFSGRRDGQLKFHGHRIEEAEILRALETIEGVTERELLLTKEGVLTAFLAPCESSRLPEIRETLRGLLPDYMIPNRIILLPGMPLTPNGKRDRAALRALSTRRKEMDPHE